MTQQNSDQFIREEFEKTTSLITGAKRLISEGRTVDLSALQDRVRNVASAVQEASPDTAAAFKEHLEVLIEILDTLEQDLQIQHTQLEDGVETLKRRKATRAYDQLSEPPRDQNEE